MLNPVTWKIRQIIIENTKHADAIIFSTNKKYCNYRRCIADGKWRVDGFDGQACWRHYGALLRDVAKSTRAPLPPLTIYRLPGQSIDPATGLEWK